jgi:hypothetical protein
LFSTEFRKLLADEDPVVNSFHMPARYRVERGGTQRFSGTEAETGMMQRTSQSVSNNEAFRKLSVVMRAACANRKELVTSAHQDDIFAPYLASGDRAVVKIANEQTLGKIALFSFFAFCHKNATAAMKFHLNGRCSPLLDGIIFLKIKIGWVRPGKWALDRRIDILQLGDAAEKLAAQAPAGRPATAEEIAEAIVFLATDRASFIHGAKLAVDGGPTAIWRTTDKSEWVTQLVSILR